MTYPLVAFAVPVWWLLRRPARPYSWLADVLLTMHLERRRRAGAGWSGTVLAALLVHQAWRHHLPTPPAAPEEVSAPPQARLAR